MMLDQPLATLVVFLHGPSGVDNAHRSALSSGFARPATLSMKQVYADCELASTSWLVREPA